MHKVKTYNAVQAGQSWTDKAKQGLVASLDYTQQGLEWTKNKVAGPTGTTGTGTAGATGTGVGHNPTGTHHQAGNTTFPSAPGANTGFTGGNTGAPGGGNAGYTGAPGGGNTGYTGAPGSGNTGYSGGQTASGFTSAPGSGNTGGSGTGSQYPDVKY